MSYSLDGRLVIGVASSAVFDLSASDAVFRSRREEAYRVYQRERLDEPLPRGVAFSFLRRLLALNDLSADPIEDPLVEVVLLSQNDPDTGLRVMRSLQHYNLPISRAIFTQGQAPVAYIPALNISLFLSGNKKDVVEATNQGWPAGHVVPSAMVDDEDDTALRIAFDFDGVLANDESEAVMQATQQVKRFHEHEILHAGRPLPPGPLQRFLLQLTRIQRCEEERKTVDAEYRNRLRVSLVTARNAPSHERAINTLNSWGVMPNDAFFLGGIGKENVLAILRPHVYFDDQLRHLTRTSAYVASVHVPYGVTNS